MPYIDKSARTRLETVSIDNDRWEVFVATTAGELNYTFTKMIQAYLFAKGESYQTYNDIIGALEGAKLELYRRKVVDYENRKIKQNGDVYDA